MIDENILREKAKNYTVCFNGECPLHDHCLRWQAGHYLPERLYSAVEPPQQRRAVVKNQVIDVRTTLCPLLSQHNFG
jgi:hypothetical protein